nr:sensor histidine kinase [uncultured Blautia sp.]
MLEGNGSAQVISLLLAIFMVYSFFLYFNIFFERKKKSSCMVTGITIFIMWQAAIPEILSVLPIAWNIGVTVGATLVVVSTVYEGKFWKRCFFCLIFDTIWMLLETLVHAILMLYYEPLAPSQSFGSFASKMLFFVVIIALKKVFMNEEMKELPVGNGILLMFIPLGSIYIMNTVFVLGYEASWEYSKEYSLISVIILLLINVLVFYVYIKLADDLQVKRMNAVYEQQLELCERHQEETEISMLQIRDVQHGIKNHFISILAYAEKGECGKIIKFINDIIEDGKLELSNTGNIVTDSLVGYWRRTAEHEGIEFQSELNIPMELPFKGADISLILGNLLENAVEGAKTAEGRKYIRLKMKYDRKNLLIVLENSYKGELVKGKGEELRTTKRDTANHGIGLPSVKRAVGKYHGKVYIDVKVKGCFLIRIVLYGVL